MRFKCLKAAVIGAVLLSAGALGQEERPAYVRALAAGYKAAFLCSNLFNGGLSEEQTEADDLRGTYPSLNPIFPTLAANVDRQRRMVSVPSTIRCLRGWRSGARASAALSFP